MDKLGSRLTALAQRAGDRMDRHEARILLLESGSGGGGSASWGGITGSLAAQADLTAALASKAALVHTHVISDVTGLQAALDGKAATAHTHVIADVAGLQAALDGKQPSGSYLTGITSGMVTTALGYTPTSVTGLTGTQSVAAFKVGLSLVKGDVGLGNVDNTSDANKPISTSQQAALDAKQDLDSDLTAIAALTTTSHGRSLLTGADAAATRTALGLGTAALNATGDFQPIDADLTAIAALSTTAYGRGLLTLADAAALTAEINAFTSALKGLAPASGGGTTNFLRADGTWAAPGGGGGVADGDKGDITVSGSGTTWTIDDGAVTYAKMQDVSATARLLGRKTAGAGDPEEIALGPALEIDGSGLLANKCKRIIKAVTTSRSSSATSTVDPDLQVSLAAGTYLIKIIAIFEATANSDYRYQTAFNGGSAVADWFHRRQTVAAGQAAGTDNEGTWTLAGLAADVSNTGTTSGLASVELEIHVTVTATTTFEFRWGQGTSHADNTSLLKGSYMLYEKLS